MSLRQFLLALRARFGVFFLMLAATVVAASTVSLLLPKSYKATASLLVDARDEQSLSNAMRPIILPQERLSYLQTQTDIIASRKVALKTVQDLQLAANPAALAILSDDPQSSVPIEDRLTENLLKRLEVETSQSNVIHASFSSTDPAFSALVANGFAKAYVDTILELRVEPAREAAAWFDEQLKGLRANLEDAQAKLTSNQQRRQIISTDERFDVENTRLAALSDEVVRAQEDTYQWNSRAQQARQFIEEGASLDRLPDVLENPFIQRLKGDYLAGETRLQEMATRYGENHPQYQRQVSENRSLREKLDAEMAKVVSGIESSAQRSRSREAALKQALASQRSRLLDLKETRNDLAVLMRNVESAERAYDAAMQRAVTSQVDSRANQANVTVLNPARAPTRPSSPKVLLNIALSMVVGVILGIGAVMLLELSDRRVRSLEDLDNAEHVPMLGELKPWKPANRLLGRAGRNSRALPNPG